MNILNYFKRDPNAPKRPATPASVPPLKKAKITVTDEQPPPPSAKSKFFTLTAEPTESMSVDPDPFQIEETPTDAEEIKPEPLPPQELVTTTTEALAQRRSVLDDDFTQVAKPQKPGGKKPGPLPKDLKDVKPRGKMLKQQKNIKVSTKAEKKDNPGVRGPLTGKTFVVTGVLEGIERDEIQDILKSYGARVTGSVSRRTSFLIYGEKLEDGRRYTEGRKYQKAKELNVKIINQRQLDEILLRLRGGESLDPHADDEALAASFDAARASASAPPSQKAGDSTALTPLPRGQPIISDDGRLWTEKYAPKTLKDVIGNAQAVEKLVNWVKDWEIVVLKGIKKDIRPNSLREVLATARSR